jgi:hypothetical protein
MMAPKTALQHSSRRLWSRSLPTAACSQCAFFPRNCHALAHTHAHLAGHAIEAHVGQGLTSGERSVHSLSPFIGCSDGERD